MDAKASKIFSIFSQWFTANRLALDDNKTNFMVFMLPRCNLVLDNLHFDGHVKWVDIVRYLGFYINCKLSWDNHLAHVSNKANRGLGMLKRCSYFFPQSCLLSLCYAFIFLFLTYGIEFWGQAAAYRLQPLRVVQKSCIRIIRKVDSR